MWCLAFLRGWYTRGLKTNNHTESLNKVVKTLLAQRLDLRVDSLVRWLLEDVSFHYEGKYRREQVADDVDISTLKGAARFDADIKDFLNRRPMRVMRALNERYVSSKGIPVDHFFQLDSGKVAVLRSSRSLRLEYDLYREVSASLPITTNTDYDTWLVSTTEAGKDKYYVDVQCGTCTCEDRMASGYICKHLFGALRHSGKQVSDLPASLTQSNILTVDVAVIERDGSLSREPATSVPDFESFYTAEAEPSGVGSSRKRKAEKMRVFLKHMNSAAWNTSDENFDEVYDIMETCYDSLVQLQASRKTTINEFGSSDYRRKRKSKRTSWVHSTYSPNVKRARTTDTSAPDFVWKKSVGRPKKRNGGAVPYSERARRGTRHAMAQQKAQRDKAQSS
ncbi:hypothetical protein CYMTET_15358 [Cymbomonas tetramitiformis]|uniref:SWIM-type domain-containing protein n=1 Tax=Cymbomonas tetramitiformis TaxID=36881 RepID=A0AAE0L936_9CHLO|nr:hypothetical protein CYMTET_15358 [Cymbomonas tetramitiformis]